MNFVGAINFRIGAYGTQTSVAFSSKDDAYPAGILRFCDNY